VGKLKKAGIGVGIAIGGFFVLMTVGSILINNNFFQERAEPEVTDTSNIQEKTPQVEEVKDAGPIIHQIGETIMMNDIVYKVTGEPRFWNGDYFNNPAGIYYRVPIQIENFEKTQQEIRNHQFTLIDEKDREFPIEYLGATGNAIMPWEELNPNLPKKFSLYFDVPYDENLQYRLEISSHKKLSFDTIEICVENCK